MTLFHKSLLVLSKQQRAPYGTFKSAVDWMVTTNYNLYMELVDISSSYEISTHSQDWHDNQAIYSLICNDVMIELDLAKRCERRHSYCATAGNLQ